MCTFDEFDSCINKWKKTSKRFVKKKEYITLVTFFILFYLAHIKETNSMS